MAREVEDAAGQRRHVPVALLAVEVDGEELQEGPPRRVDAEVFPPALARRAEEIHRLVRADLCFF